MPNPDARRASCRCGSLTATCSGPPVRTLVCHCLACQQQSGSAFGTQVLFEAANVRIDGPSREWVRTADSGRHVAYRFCPECGSNIAYRTELEPSLLAIPLGAFEDPYFTKPDVAFDERRRHKWVNAEAGEHHD